MKRAKKNTTWYNTRNKELNSIFLESRRTAARYGGPYPDPRLALRLGSVYPDFQTAIL